MKLFTKVYIEGLHMNLFLKVKMKGLHRVWTIWRRFLMEGLHLNIFMKVYNKRFTSSLNFTRRFLSINWPSTNRQFVNSLGSQWKKGVSFIFYKWHSSLLSFISLSIPYYFIFFSFNWFELINDFVAFQWWKYFSWTLMMNTFK